MFDAMMEMHKMFDDNSINGKKCKMIMTIILILQKCLKMHNGSYNDSGI